MGGRIRHGHISCPVHGVRFNLETGAAVGKLTNKSIKIYRARATEDWLEVCEISA
jgi:3-phenylpropionate/trans-cinnamate dioxygenase ferredoxin subunit